VRDAPAVTGDARFGVHCCRLNRHRVGRPAPDFCIPPLVELRSGDAVCVAQSGYGYASAKLFQQFCGVDFHEEFLPGIGLFRLELLGLPGEFMPDALRFEDVK
jgi:hypothetical protein